MESKDAKLLAHEKKQALLLKYYTAMSNVKSERKLVNTKFKSLERAFNDLLNSQADDDQLKLFDNIDQFLKVPGMKDEE